MTIMILCVWHRSSSALLIISWADRGKGREYRVRRPPTNVFLQLSSSQNIRISQDIRVSRNVRYFRILEYFRISEYLRVLYVHHPSVSSALITSHSIIYSSNERHRQYINSSGPSCLIPKVDQWSYPKSFLNTNEHHFNGVTCSFFL